MLINDRQILLSIGRSRKETAWQQQTLYWSELAQRLSNFARGTETLAQYMALSKPQQDDLKDVGGFVAGSLRGTRRKASAVAGRDVVTLDLDNVPAGATDDVLCRVDALGVAYVVYSTRKHRPDAPRLRVLVLLHRTVTADEYEPIARWLMQRIDPHMELCDPTTFEAHRLMYWPSCCVDSQPVYVVGDHPMLHADGVLAQYADWHDVKSWPVAMGEQQRIRHADKLGDPREKPGAVGAFCRCYDIYRAMEELLPGAYLPTDTQDRYTYAGGSTAGGAVVYDDGLYLYSHHATDPCSGREVNSFDLVRLHRFSELDDDTPDATPVNRRPSYTAMVEYAVSLSEVSVAMTSARRDQLLSDFSAAQVNSASDAEWISRLEINRQTGTVATTSNNILLILDNDPAVAHLIALNAMSHRRMLMGAVPWDRGVTAPRAWTDDDDAGVRWYLETAYRVSHVGRVQDAVALTARRNAYNPLQDYLTALYWDGVPRLDTLLVDFMGALDTPYVRAVTRKAFVAAVARAYHPGIPYDQVLILNGPQGCGKTTLIKAMGKQWYSDAIKDFSGRGKSPEELVQGVWIAELGELRGLAKAEVDTVKQFLSCTEDHYRPAYGRNVEHRQRLTVFFGTSNDGEFLRDDTGARRFWPVDCMDGPRRLSPWSDLQGIVDQLWAEAKVRWAAGEELHARDEIARLATVEQENHRVTDPREGAIAEFLATPVPLDWYSRSLEARVGWYGSAYERAQLPPGQCMLRDRVCAAEVWCELFGKKLGDLRPRDAADIISAISRVPGWEKGKNGMRFGSAYGLAKGCKRT